MESRDCVRGEVLSCATITPLDSSHNIAAEIVTKADLLDCTICVLRHGRDSLLINRPESPAILQAAALCKRSSRARPFSPQKVTGNRCTCSETFCPIPLPRTRTC